jgi:hypothetical protein
MPYARKPVSPETLLGLIKPGLIYSPNSLARKINGSASDVRKVLLTLVDEGKLATIKPHRTVSFILARTEHLRRKPAPKPVIDPATVAQPRTFAVLTGELTGYFEEMYRRADLAMMVRSR